MDGNLHENHLPNEAHIMEQAYATLAANQYLPIELIKNLPFTPEERAILVQKHPDTGGMSAIQRQVSQKYRNDPSYRTSHPDMFYLALNVSPRKLLAHALTQWQNCARIPDFDGQINLDARETITIWAKNTIAQGRIPLSRMIYASSQKIEGFARQLEQTNGLYPIPISNDGDEAIPLSFILEHIEKPEVTLPFVSTTYHAFADSLPPYTGQGGVYHQYYHPNSHLILMSIDPAECIVEEQLRLSDRTEHRFSSLTYRPEMQLPDEIAIAAAKSQGYRGVIAHKTHEQELALFAPIPVSDIIQTGITHGALPRHFQFM